MGIQGLIPMLKPAHTWREMSHYSGQTLAVDAYVWLHKGAFSCAEELVNGQTTPKLVNYCMHRVRMLKYHGIKPYIVFDGGALPAKLATEDDRAQRRDENLIKATALHKQGRTKEARELYTKCIDVTPELALQFIKALRAESVSYVVAPYEADAQLAYLERQGLVDGIITEDSDLLVFGCRNVLFKMDTDGKCCEISRETIGFGDGLGGMGGEFRFDGWGDSQFRHMAILAGCDYLPSVSGVGIKTAHKLLRRLKTVEKVLQHLRLEGKEIPVDYRKRFRLAELTFLHQRVYDPQLERIVPLSPLPDGFGDEECNYIGPDLDPKIAKGIALGERNPITKLVMIDPWPNFMPLAVKTPVKHQPKITDMFQRAPKPSPSTALRQSASAPTPSSSRMAFGKGSGSGRQRLSDVSMLSAVARGKLPERAAPIEDDSDVDVEADEDDAQGTATVKKSKFFSAKTTTTPTVRSTRARSDQPVRSIVRVDSLEEDLPTVDQVFERLRPSSPDEVESSFPPGFDNITPPSDKSSPAPGSGRSLSPCAPATPQAEPIEDPAEIFSSPASTRVRRARESSMDGYISSSPPRRGETPRKLDVGSREDSPAAVEEAEMEGEAEAEPDPGAPEVDLREICTNDVPLRPLENREKAVHDAELGTSSVSSDVGGSDQAEDGEGSTEDKHAVIAKGWRERFSMKKPASPFNKSSPLMSRTSLPTPTRPLGSRSISANAPGSASARSLSTPNFLTSRAANAPPSSVQSLNETPIPNGLDLFARKPEAPRSLPPRFIFPPARGKENASIPSAATPKAVVATKRKRADLVIDLDEDENEVLVLGSSQKRRATPSSSSSQDRRDSEDERPASQLQNSPTRTHSVRKKLDVFRFRPKLC